MRDKEVLNKLKGAHIECENPNEMLYKFEGNFMPKDSSQIIPLGPDQMLLRGSSLRNTEYVYGLVVFTGHESKIMKNSVGSRAKFSKLELTTNTYIILIVGI
jgi:phospholipid-transporting ATPase